MPTSLRLDPTLERLLEARAEREQVSKTALIHRALREFLLTRDSELVREARRQCELANAADAGDDWEAFDDPRVWK